MLSAMQFPNGWRQASVALVLLLTILFSIYFETATAMVSIWWQSETFTHGFLVLPISMWLIWRMRDQILAITPEPSLVALGILAAIAFTWLLGTLVAVNAVTMFAFTTMMAMVVPTVLGWKIAKVLTFPLAYLFFMVPFGEVFMPQLMDWTADFTVSALRISGIPVFREGNQFVIPSGNWSVVEACSGIRYLLASITVGSLFAYLNYRSNRRRLVFVAFSILMPIVANWLRAYLIVLLGHVSGNKLAVGVDHLIYGWVFFGAVILLMFMVGARWAEQIDVPILTAVPVPSDKQNAVDGKVWRFSFVFALIIALPHFSLSVLSKSENSQPIVLPKSGLTSTEWQLSSGVDWDFKPVFENPAFQSNQIYTKSTQQVGLYLGFYRNQTFSSKLVSSNNVVVTTKDPAWARIGGDFQPVNLGSQIATFRATELRGIQAAARSNLQGMTVWQIYWINGTITSNDYLAKIYGAFYRLAGRGDDSAVIVIYAPKIQGENVDGALEQFLKGNYVTIDAFLKNLRTVK